MTVRATTITHPFSTIMEEDTAAMDMAADAIIIATTAKEKEAKKKEAKEKEDIMVVAKEDTMVVAKEDTMVAAKEDIMAAAKEDIMVAAAKEDTVAAEVDTQAVGVLAGDNNELL